MKFIALTIFLSCILFFGMVRSNAQEKTGEIATDFGVRRNSDLLILKDPN